MEPSGATSGNRWQMDTLENRSNKPIRNRWQPRVAYEGYVDGERNDRRQGAIYERELAIIVAEVDNQESLPNSGAAERRTRSTAAASGDTAVIDCRAGRGTRTKGG
jgi:hypothetical protein